MNEAKEKQPKNKLKKIFKSFLLWGIISLLASALIDVTILQIEKIKEIPIIEHAIKILTISLDSVGAGFIIGFFIDMVKNSEDYIKYIKSNLEDVVVSQNFLDNLSKDKKAEIVFKCFSNENSSLELKKYIEYKVCQIAKLSNGTIRSNIDYITTASKKNNKIILNTTMSYKIYKNNNEYQAIRHVFDKSSSKILSMEIVPTHGKKYKFNETMLKTKKTEINHNETAYINVVNIPNHLKGENTLTLKITVEEEGYDHWAHLVWMSLYPTDCITYKIICKDGLIIKKSQIFDNQKGLYYTTQSIDKNNHITEYTITCEEWTDPYTGFSLIISEP